jgi:tetratricopeptide (TPR) repeat protein
VPNAELLVDLDSGTQSGVTGLGSLMGAAELEDLRWYLEDYLQTPFGVYSDRGSQIAGQLAGWGRALFDSALGAEGGGEQGDLHRRGVAEIVLRSEVPERLALPWELMRAPGASAPVVLDGIGITRCVAANSTSDSFDAAGERLRVLMVISRPAGVNDVGYQMIARPLLRSMASAHGAVDLEVLRPPTLEALAARLRDAHDAGAPFQLVHFDGHGAATGEGALAFESPGGSADLVSSERLAKILTATGVPVAVLNACQSGAIGKRLETAVATGLLSGGVDAVVAMSHRVYTVAAAEFMTAFYNRLLSGGTIGEAVREGRSRMVQHPSRPSPKGALPLEDWVVPVYYRRREVRFPQLRAVPPSAPATALDNDPLAQEEEFVGRDSLFCALETAASTGRVLVLHGPSGTGKTELAKAFGRWWRNTCGIDRPDGVFWHSFGSGVSSRGLDSAIGEIGLCLYGPGFAQEDRGTRRDMVLEQLRAHRLLLVWDNFESVATMPGDVTSPLGETGRAELKDFLHTVAAQGQSTILVTSRTREDWLGAARRLTIGGLLPHEAIEYADQILAPFPAAVARRADRSFAELLEWLDGHPLSMRVVLPHLATTEPAALLAGLRGTQPLPIAEEDTAEGAPAEYRARTRSLSASIGYSFVHLSSAGRRLLVALSFLSGAADAEVLGAFSSSELAPQRFCGVSVGEWEMVLSEAAHLGLLTTRADGGYGIHPALPAYLAARWRSEEPGIYLDTRTAADRALLDAIAALSKHWGKTMEAEATAEAYGFISRNLRTIARMLSYALGNRLWKEALPLYITLEQYLYHGGRTEEALGWSDRARSAAEGPGGIPDAGDLPDLRLEDLLDLSALSDEELREFPAERLRELDEQIQEAESAASRWAGAMPALTLWIVVVRSQADMLSKAGDLDAAEALYRKIHQVGEKNPDLNRAVQGYGFIGHGSAAQSRGQFRLAEEMYQTALASSEEAGDRQRCASPLLHLGYMAHGQGRWDEAEQYYQQVLAILEEPPGHLQSSQYTYDALGLLAEGRGRLNDAEECYYKALGIAEQRHDWDGKSRFLRSLGRLCRKRRHLEAAERFLRRCLALEEGLRSRPGRAAVYFELGVVELLRGKDESDKWLRQALALHEELGDSDGVASDDRALGLIAIARRQWDEARQLLSESLAITRANGHREATIECYQLLGELEHKLGRWEEAERWLREALALAQDMGHEITVAACYLQLGVTAEARGDAPEALECTVRAQSLARRFPQAAHQTAPGQMLNSVTRQLGIGAVEECWERLTGEPLPGDLRQLALTDENAN